MGPAPRGCESPWYVIACVKVFFLFAEEFKSDRCCLYSVLGKKERGEELAEKWAHEKERDQSPCPERQLLGEGSPSPQPLLPVVTPTPTDVLMEEEEEEEAKKTGEETGKEKEEQERRGSTQGRQDTETAEAEGGRKGAEAGGGGVAKEPEGVTTRAQKRRARDTGAGEEEGQWAVVEWRGFVMGKHLQVVVCMIGVGQGVETKVDIEADTCLGEYKGERIEGTAPESLTGRGDKVLCIKGGGADSRTRRGV